MLIQQYQINVLLIVEYFWTLHVIYLTIVINKYIHFLQSLEHYWY